MTGKLGERAARWVSFVAAQPRDVWTRGLREAGVACEPVLGPGELLADPHLAVRRPAGELMIGSPIEARPLRGRASRRSRLSSFGPNEDGGVPRGPALLAGLRTPGPGGPGAHGGPG